jgi:conjugal transfer pilus assembly protein TraF
MKKVIFILIIFTISQNTYAFEFTEKICREYGLGTNWYCKKDVDEQKGLSARDILDSKVPDEQKAIMLNQLWKTQIKRATISGKKQDIIEFLETHYIITSKGIEFSRNVQKIIDNSPQLFKRESYYLNKVNSEIKQQELIDILGNASQQYGLVLIYSPHCAHCIRQLPIIQKLSKNYNLKTLGITDSNEFLEGLDSNISDASITSDPLVQAYPTILLLDKEQPQKIFISKGLTTFDDLEEKIYSKIKDREISKEAE